MGSMWGVLKKDLKSVISVIEEILTLLFTEAKKVFWISKTRKDWSTNVIIRTIIIYAGSMFGAIYFDYDLVYCLYSEFFLWLFCYLEYVYIRARAENGEEKER